MTLYSIVNTIKNIALTQPNVTATGEGDLYADFINNGNVKYATVYIVQQAHTSNLVNDTETYNFIVYYIDRCDDNAVEIQSHAKDVLKNIVTSTCNALQADCNRIEYRCFTQKFLDLCAGAYATFSLQITSDSICPEDYA